MVLAVEGVTDEIGELDETRSPRVDEHGALSKVADDVPSVASLSEGGSEALESVFVAALVQHDQAALGVAMAVAAAQVVVEATADLFEGILDGIFGPTSDLSTTAAKIRIFGRIIARTSLIAEMRSGRGKFGQN